MKLLVVLYTGWCSQSSSAPRSSRPVRRQYHPFANTNSARRAPARGGRDNHGRKPRLCITVCGSSRRVPLLAVRAAAIMRLYASYLSYLPTHMPLDSSILRFPAIMMKFPFENVLQVERSKGIFFFVPSCMYEAKIELPLSLLSPLGHSP